MNKTTQELLDILKTSPSIDDYLNQEEAELTETTLKDSLEALLIQKDLTVSECVKYCSLDSHYAYQIFSGIKKNPSRDKVLALCFAMHLTIEETQRLLKLNHYPPLYARIKRDSFILFCLDKTASITDVNELLYDCGYPLLS